MAKYLLSSISTVDPENADEVIVLMDRTSTPFSPNPASRSRGLFRCNSYRYYISRQNCDTYVPHTGASLNSDESTVTENEKTTFNLVYLFCGIPPGAQRQGAGQTTAAISPKDFHAKCARDIGSR